MQFYYEAILNDDSSGVYGVNFPDLGVATEGEGLDRAIYMAIDLLRMVVTSALADDEKLPKATFGHQLEEDEQSVIIAIETSIEEAKEWWPWLLTSEAAEKLGVSIGRVHQLVASGALRSIKEGRDIQVSRADVEARLAAPPRAGRPKKREQVAA